MKIVLVGAGGQLAHDLIQSFADHQVICWTREQIDLRQPEGVKEKLAAVQAEAVINAAAYNLVDQAESEPTEAYLVNAFGPRALAQACGQLDIPFCHFSTDYVYGLEVSAEPWSETDAPGPVSVYGASKLAGEYFVRTHCPKHYVLRTCGLYGVKGSRGKGGNFVETMLKLAAKGGPVRVVNDQICTPSYTADIAKATAELFQTKQYGLYHLTNRGQCTWFELASEVFRQSGHTVDCQPITSQEFGAKAKRPPYSVLSTAKLESAGVSPMPEWQDALSRYLKARKPQ